jgi:hypothetical protein
MFFSLSRAPFNVGAALPISMYDLNSLLPFS